MRKTRQVKWFKHMSDLRREPTLLDARTNSDCGLELYAFVILVIETLADNMDYEARNTSLELSERAWCVALGIDMRTFRKYAPKVKNIDIISATCRQPDSNSLPVRWNFDCPKLLEWLDNYSKNLQVSCSKKKRKKEEVDIDKDPIPPIVPQGDHDLFGGDLPASDDDPKPAPKLTPKQQAVVDAWNATAEKHGLPRALTVTGKRLRDLRKRLQDSFWAENYQAALDAIDVNRYWVGGTEHCYRMTLDYFLRDTTVAMLVETASKRRDVSVYQGKPLGAEPFFKNIRRIAGGPLPLAQDAKTGEG